MQVQPANSGVALEASPDKSRTLSIKVKTKTEHYDPSKASLHWSRRIGFRNLITLVSSVIPGALGSACYGGLYLAVHSLQGGPLMRVEAWVAGVAIFLEAAVFSFKSGIGGFGFMMKKLFFWLVMVIVWGISAALLGGDLGLSSFVVLFGAWWIAIVLSDLVVYGKTLVHSLANATVIGLVFFATFSQCAGYTYLANSISDVRVELFVTGFAYPLFSHLLKEIVFDLVSVEADKDLGLGEGANVEDGTFIACVALMEAYKVITDMANKVAIASIKSTLGFLAALVISMAVEVAVTLGAAFWHRTKAAGQDLIAKYILRQKPIQLEESVTSSFRERLEEHKARRNFLAKASYRHYSGEEKKSYEFRIYYQELAESVATIAAVSMLVVEGSLTPDVACARLFASLASELFADVFVWSILEREGYFLCNVTFNWSPALLFALNFIVIMASIAITIGHEMVAIFASVPNATIAGRGNFSNTSVANGSL